MSRSGGPRASTNSRRASRSLVTALIELATAKEALRHVRSRCAELADQRAYLMCVRGHVDYLATIVGSILILVRTAQRGLALELSDVPVRELLAEVHTLVEPFAVAGGVSLVVDCEHAPAVVRGERTALLWVLVNLAANAVKFTPSGGRVSLSAVVLSDAVELRVADTGPGILVSRPDAIVEPVVQAHSTDEGQRRGAGLSIARELTRLMGGELLVRTAVDVGPQVVVRFGDAWRPAQQSARVSTAKAA